ncbi:hypothetical protein HOU02_gp363 [Caulobacter phage CcrBL9]|uniref:Uncharacterized protein n=1 Tax=Caulobacter phage CcrBL9 TaxID=2283270 RepID=A0A385EET5_9CAUD|nr:hypothetical protein HOU02_gp363 [Caulobacter phage CcrBL9]AXQ69362.1 hypothetical protein CcrBL9_gp338 [Caulobacter phage CcrBL9]
MSRVVVHERNDRSIFYMVALDGAGPPTRLHADPDKALKEAKRLTKHFKRPARILMQIGMVFPTSQPDSVIVANFAVGQWYTEHGS